MILRTIPLLLALTGCGGGATPAPTAPNGGHDGADHGEAPTTGKADAHAGHDATDAVGAYVGVDAEGARVFFVAPADGERVTSPVKVVFGAEGVKVLPAGQLVPNTGHHHVILDGEPAAEGMGVPKDDQHIHYGNGQTEAELELPPGVHRLTMQFADGAHRSYGAGMAATITVEVVAPDAPTQPAEEGADAP